MNKTIRLKKLWIIINSSPESQPQAENPKGKGRVAAGPKLLSLELESLNRDYTCRGEKHLKLPPNSIRRETDNRHYTNFQQRVIGTFQ